MDAAGSVPGIQTVLLQNLLVTTTTSVCVQGTQTAEVTVRVIPSVVVMVCVALEVCLAPTVKSVMKILGHVLSVLGTMTVVVLLENPTVLIQFAWHAKTTTMNNVVHPLSAMRCVFQIPVLIKDLTVEHRFV